MDTTTDKATINGKEYDGWYCLNGTAFLAVVGAGLTKMFHLTDSQPASMNPITDVSKLDNEGKKIRKSLR